MTRENPNHDWLDKPHRLDFFQAVRLLRKLSPNLSPVGGDAAPREECVRFSVSPSLGFPAGEISELTKAAVRPGAERYELEVNFLGLVGPAGVLPTFYGEIAVEERKGGPLRDFLDLFHHRLVSLFYRAWERNRPYLSTDPESRARFEGYLRSVAGLGLGPLDESAPESTRELLGHAGLFSRPVRSAEGLRVILLDALNGPDGPLGEPGPAIDLEIVPCVGRWLKLNEDEKTRLGRGGPRLGSGAILGGRVRDHQGKFRLQVGPLTLRQFRLLLPEAKREEGGPTPFDRLVSRTRAYAGPMYDFDIQLVLSADEVPACSLGRGESAPRLGRTWLTPDQPDRDQVATIPSYFQRRGY